MVMEKVNIQDRSTYNFNTLTCEYQISVMFDVELSVVLLNIFKSSPNFVLFCQFFS